LKNGIETFYAKTRQDWRKWLEENHQAETSVWLIIYRKESKIPSVYYPEAVSEALCFGWVDSKANKRDKNSYFQFFAKRNPKSNWSKINKEKVAELIAQGLMAPAGLKMIEIAQQKGTWTALDDVELLAIPADLQLLFENSPQAFAYWEKFPRSSKRSILEWIQNAKKPETRKIRVEETVKLAAKDMRANHYRQRQT
jgi:uncharacterized protein YdeI (YjbR/CyaY-like superfamily)